MSDHWEFFPCQMGESTAFIFYDHGLASEIDELDLGKLLKIRVQIKNPREDGLPFDEEFGVLERIEDEIQSYISNKKGIYAGRVTVDGARYFHCYVDLDEAGARGLLDGLKAKYGYEMRYVLKEDRERSGYWEELFPTDQDWQVMKDLKVIEQLEKHGDNLDKRRRIDHWVFFESRDKLEKFKSWAMEEGFKVEGVSEPEKEEDDDRYSIQLYHNGTPQLAEISHVTVTLLETARELGGDYDGWETSVEPDED